MKLSNLKGLTLDMDGVLWRGGTPLPGFVELFYFLDRYSIPFMLATNNARKTPEQYLDRFHTLGAPSVKRENLLSSALATGAYLIDELEPGSKVYVLGEDGIRDAVREGGFTLLTNSAEPADAVVVGLDFNLTYEKLKDAAWLIRQGARFIGTNGDLTYPVENGFHPGAGAILKAVEAGSGVTPTVIGKPNRLMFEIALKKLGCQSDQAAMVGDRLETDILGGQQAGLKTILVTSGVDNEESIVTKGIQPDLILSGIAELVERWQAELT